VLVGVLVLAWVLPHAGLAGPAARARAAPAVTPQTLEVRLGFDGVLKAGVPVPLEVTVPPLPDGGPAELSVDAPALGPQAGAVVTSTVVPFQAIAGAARAFQVPVVIADLRRPLTIRVVIAGREVLRRNLLIDPAEVGGRVVVAVSGRRAGLEVLHHLSGRTVVAYIADRMLPRLWQEYAALDLLVIRDLDEGNLEEAQRRALLTWVRLGGRVLVIPRDGHPLPPFLQPVLPAALGEPRRISSLAGLTARYGAPFPPGPYAVATLTPRPGAAEVRSDTLPLIAAAPVGWGRVTVLAFDPFAPPYQTWAGRVGFWKEMLGPPASPRVNVEEVAGRFPQRTPLDPTAHAAVGAAILGYVSVLFLLQRWWRSTAGAVTGLAIAGLGIAVFAFLAYDVRTRSITLSQVTFLEQAPGASVAQVTAVAVVAVPYGGGYRVAARPGLLAGPVGPTGNVRVTLASQGMLFAGRLSPQGSLRAFWAVGAVPMAATGWLAADGRRITVDLGSDRLHRAELRSQGRVYFLGEFPPGRSTREIPAEPAGLPPAEGGQDAVRGWLFRPPGGESADVIMERTMPMLVGEFERATPAFTLQGVGGPGQRLTILLVPLARQ